MSVIMTEHSAWVNERKRFYIGPLSFWGIILVITDVIFKIACQYSVNYVDDVIMSTFFGWPNYFKNSNLWLYIPLNCLVLIDWSGKVEWNRLKKMYLS